MRNWRPPDWASVNALHLRLPPTLAGLPPQITPHTGWRFALAVGMGTVTLMVIFLLARPVPLKHL